MPDSIDENSSHVRQEANEVVTELGRVPACLWHREGQLKLEVIQTLLEPCNRSTYGQKLKEAAAKLDKSVRTVQRLVKKWEQEGLVALTTVKRSDRGSFRIDEELQQFILNTYKEGNKGGKRITPKQVFLRSKAKAESMGITSLSHMTIVQNMACMRNGELLVSQSISILMAVKIFAPIIWIEFQFN